MLEMKCLKVAAKKRFVIVLLVNSPFLRILEVKGRLKAIKKVTKSEDEWKNILSPQKYHVLRMKGTEPAFTGKLLKNKKTGMYVCAACGNPLFTSDTKFDSGTGWPSFWEAVSKDSVETKVDNSWGTHRIEVTCKKCGGHLGHVFDDGPTPTGQRFCINSISLNFKEQKDSVKKPKK
jgi:peptide-methionine (R)-S-oxide reductase